MSRQLPQVDPAKELTKQLNASGFEGELPVEEGFIEIGEIIKGLPATLPIGDNPARKALDEYYRAIPYSRRRKGVFMRPEAIMSLLMDRMQFFDKLTRDLVRKCRGTDCEHFKCCPFASIVEDITIDDREDCAVDREVVQGLIDSFVRPDNGDKPRLDPRKTELMVLFGQLVQLFVKQNWLRMTMRLSPVEVNVWEPLKDGASEHFDSMNKAVNPIMEQWDKNQEKIMRVMREMGLSPEFQIKQGMWIDTASQMDAEQRAAELAIEMLQTNYRNLYNKLPEDDPNRQLLLEALNATINSANEAAE